MGDELFDQGGAAGAVGGAIGEDVVPGAAVGIEHDANEVSAHADPSLVDEPRGHEMVAAEAGDDVKGRPLLGPFGADEVLGHDHRRALFDLAAVEGRELRAVQLDQRDPVA